MSGPMMVAVILGLVVVMIAVAAGLDHRRLLRRRFHYYPPPPARKKREWMLWVGDGTAPAGPHLIGTPVNIDGRTGKDRKVVDATQLQIQVEWD